MTSYVIPGVGLFQAPTAGGTFQLPGGLLRVPSTGGGGGTTIPVFRHHYVQQGIG